MSFKEGDSIVCLVTDGSVDSEEKEGGLVDEGEEGGEGAEEEEEDEKVERSSGAARWGTSRRCRGSFERPANYYLIG